MLAQNFKTAKELKISPELCQALQKVLTRLETGDLVYVSDHANTMFTVSDGFNMNWEYKETKCGTVACIAGWAAVEMGETDVYVVIGTRGLRPLFYPGSFLHNVLGGSLDHDLITAEEAATVLRHYLTTGEISWVEVYKKQKQNGQLISWS